MKSTLTFLALIIVCQFCKAQQHMLFSKVWGSCGYYHFSTIIFADQLGNGDFILIGGTTTEINQGDRWFYACRTDSAGEILWENIWGGPALKLATGSVVKFEDSYVIVGSNGNVGRKIAASRIDQNGDVLFSYSYDFGMEDCGVDIMPTYDSCFMIIGNKNYQYENGYPVILKIDQLGNEVTRRPQSYITDHKATRIAATPDSGYIICGNVGYHRNSYIQKMSKFGIPEWIRYPFGLGDSVNNSIGELRVNPDGTFDIFHGIGNTNVYDYNPMKGALVHYDSYGNTISVRSYTERMTSVFLDEGGTRFCGVNEYMFLSEMNEDNEFERLNTEGICYINGFIRTREGGFFGYGCADGCENMNSRMLIAKFGSDGRYAPQAFLANISVYPNPSITGEFTLTFDLLTDEDVHITLLTIDGRVIFTDRMFCPANSHTSYTLNATNNTTAAGTYILELRTSGEYRRQLVVIGRQRPE